jgi:hypothetical protein
LKTTHTATYADEYFQYLQGRTALRKFLRNAYLRDLTDRARVIRRIFESCHRVGIVRVVFTVPGHKGYASDKTHRTFIDVTYLEKHGVTENEFYRLGVRKYFPLNSELFGRYFTHNELRLVFDARK